MKGGQGTGTGRVLSKKDIKKDIIIADPPSNAEGASLHFYRRDFFLFNPSSIIHCSRFLLCYIVADRNQHPGDIHWPIEESGAPSDVSTAPRAVRFTPQLYFGTARAIQTENPSITKIIYKAFYHNYGCSGHGDRRYFHVLENAYQKNTPTVCFVLPDNVFCWGDVSIS